MHAIPFHLLAQLTTVARLNCCTSAPSFWLLVVHFIPFANKAALKRNLMPGHSRANTFVQPLPLPFHFALAGPHFSFSTNFSFLSSFSQGRKMSAFINIYGRFGSQSLTQTSFCISNCLIIIFRLVRQREFLISNCECALVHRKQFSI